MPKKFFDIIPPKIETVPRRRTVPGKEKLELKKGIEPSPQHIKEKNRFKRVFLKSLVFCLALLIPLVVAGFLFLSKVEIEIWPETDILSLKETVTIDLDTTERNFETKTIPGKIFTDVKFASQNFSASGKMLKEEKATGIIRVYNAYSASSRTLVPSRFVSSDGKLFWSIKKITIPGMRYEKGKLVPGEIDVEVMAAEPGEDYNIEPSTFALPALAGTALYTTIYGRSFSPMTGGFKGEISQITQEDLEEAEGILIEKLKRESKEFLKTALPTDFILLDETISQEIIEAESSAEALAEAESFDFQAKVKSEGLAFKKSDMEDFSKNCINLNISEDKKFQEESLEINYFPETLASTGEAGGIDLESGKIILNLEIKVKIYSDIDLDGLKKALFGKSLNETKIFLENLPRVNKIEIKSWPFLKKKVPENIDKIEIMLNLDPSP